MALSAMWRAEPERYAAEHPVKPHTEELSLVTDEEALTRLKVQDKDALALLFERYARLVMTIAFRVLRDRGEAEDLMQNFFLYLFRKADLYDVHKGSAGAWITQRAYFHALNRRNFLANRQFYVGTDFDSEVDTLAGKFDLEQEIGAKHNREQIFSALGELPEKQRATLELSFFEGLSLREISERLGESLENVRHNYYRGLNKLRKNTLVQNLRDKKL
jgi:RNA polymerase sigma-70 factor, ECF subfamily